MLYQNSAIQFFSEVAKITDRNNLDLYLLKSNRFYIYAFLSKLLPLALLFNITFIYLNTNINVNILICILYKSDCTCLPIYIYNA